MSSSSSASALNRSRSLRQPTAGLSRALRKDDTSSNNNNNVVNNTTNNVAPANKSASAAAASSTSSAGVGRTTSPSRLPKPPGGAPIATRTRAATAGKSSGIPSAATAGTKSRPTSGIFKGSDSIAARKPVTQAAGADQAEPSKSSRPAPITTSRLIRPPTKSISTSSRPAQTSSEPSPTTPSRPSPSRPSPLRATPPKTTTSPSPARTASPRTTTHIRAKSSATALNSATVLRPPRPPSAGSVMSTSTTATTTTAASKKPIGRSNTTAATRSAHLRQASATSSNASALGRAASTNAAKFVKPTPAAGDAPRLKPAFNTLQQHYSPARNLAPKPLTSSYLAPPSPSKLPANIAISSETARLQTELLQLHLLHRDADAVAASWHASAKQRLGQRFAELARRDEEVGRGEAEVEEARNLAALMAWGGGKGLDGKIQVLDAVLSGVWSLGEPNGRYTRVVRKFEKWADQTRRAVEARRVAGGLGALMDDDEVGFVIELDPAWKDEVSSMARKLDSWRRQLGQLESGVFDGNQGEDLKSCSVARLVSGCRSQVHGMLAELDLMEQLERDALAQETAWIRRMNRGDDESDTPRAGAIWRAF